MCPRVGPFRAVVSHGSARGGRIWQFGRFAASGSSIPLDGWRVARRSRANRAAPLSAWDQPCAIDGGALMRHRPSRNHLSFCRLVLVREGRINHDGTREVVNGDPGIRFHGCGKAARDRAQGRAKCSRRQTQLFAKSPACIGSWPQGWSLFTGAACNTRRIGLLRRGGEAPRRSSQSLSIICSFKYRLASELPHGRYVHEKHDRLSDPLPKRAHGLGKSFAW